MELAQHIHGSPCPAVSSSHLDTPLRDRANIPPPPPRRPPRRRRRGVLLAFLAALLLVGAGLLVVLGFPASNEGAKTDEASGPAELATATEVWRGDFESGDFNNWSLGEGSGIQRVSEDRIRLVDSPVAQGEQAARFEVRSGDLWRGSSARAELANNTGGTAVGEDEVRWYDWHTRLDPSYPIHPSGWQVLSQWHPGSGSPLIRLNVEGERLRLRATPRNGDGSNAPSLTIWEGPLERGKWHRFQMRVHWSSNPDTGSIELWHNGEVVAGRTNLRTLLPNGNAYIKQGLYRDPSIDEVGVVFHDGMTVSKP